MIWLIIGIILFAMTLYVHKHTYTERIKGVYKDKIPCPLWLVILFFIVFCIPIIGAIAFFIGMVFYLANSIGSSQVIYFKPEGIVKKIEELLTKEV